MMNLGRLLDPVQMLMGLGIIMLQLMPEIMPVQLMIGIPCPNGLKSRVQLPLVRGDRL